jgi:hypothetical protein
MPHKVFLSHNHADKPLVEAVAIRLAQIFGEDQVFYDSWSIKPGDGIIEQMNRGLEAPDFVFFFVSQKSLASEMVRLEWQNAVYAATKGKTRIVPVRLDGSNMPAVLMQTLYIDMHSIGLEAAIAQIVSVALGNASFAPQQQGFSNLSFKANRTQSGEILITVTASHLFEHNPQFAVMVGNTKEEITFSVSSSEAYTSGFDPDKNLSDGTAFNAILLKRMNFALKPGFPLRLSVKPTGQARIDFLGLLHQVGEDEWGSVPGNFSG